MSVTTKILKIISDIILPKDENDDLPPDIIYCTKEFARKINDEEPLDESDSSESAYYLMIYKEKPKTKASCVETPFGLIEIPLGLRFEELTKTENKCEGIFYFKDSWWKIKSGKYVYTNHLDEII